MSSEDSTAIRLDKAGFYLFRQAVVEVREAGPDDPALARVTAALEAVRPALDALDRYTVDLTVGVHDGDPVITRTGDDSVTVAGALTSDVVRRLPDAFRRVADELGDPEARYRTGGDVAALKALADRVDRAGG
ncbi:hypothetical protein GCM10022243_29880 [Saccharothrix violaceirubra]|uniref:Uncharacterized protein n=1 Tax=Saccharothrix violaceirubra TaxID=413306 RepID=A0A7W7T603_9PSEU|nr:hypothetical protein [Saccharothrix violaceirubra]MBB4966612.1 hypothetical protein [Saccharothrix violaceirubra]